MTISANILQWELESSAQASTGDVSWTPRKGGVPCWMTVEVVLMVVARKHLNKPPGLEN